MSEWISVAKRRPPQRKEVDVWMDIYASPRSFGMGDSFRVVEAWRVGDQWFHRQNGKEMELYADYVSHWMPIPKSPRKRP